MAKLTKDQKRKKQQELKRKQSITKAQTVNRVRNELLTTGKPLVDFFDSHDESEQPDIFDPSALTNEERELKPKTGDTYISSKPVGMKFFIESSGGFEDEEGEYYNVELIDYANKENFDAAGDSLSPNEWVKMVKTYGLVREC
jgi:hypothetical protein